MVESMKAQRIWSLTQSLQASKQTGPASRQKHIPKKQQTSPEETIKNQQKRGTEFSFRPPFQYISAALYSLAAFGQPAQPPPLSAEAQDAALSP